MSGKFSESNLGVICGRVFEGIPVELLAETSRKAFVMIPKISRDSKEILNKFFNDSVGCF